MKLGKNMQNALKFVTVHPGWHTFASDRVTVNAIKKLADLGLVKIAGNQFTKA